MKASLFESLLKVSCVYLIAWFQNFTDFQVELKSSRIKSEKTSFYWILRESQNNIEGFTWRISLFLL